MNKSEFLSELRKRLSGLPNDGIEERLSFYAEMLDDKVEEGLTEEDAVSEIGSVEQVASEIVSDIPLSKLVKEKLRPKRRYTVWEIVLLSLGSPIWLSLLIAAFAVIISIYAAIWSVVASLWAVFVALVASAPGGVFGGTVFAVTGNMLSGIAVIGAGIFSAGLAILMFFGCKAATKGIILLTKKITLAVKKGFMGKENA